MAEPPAIVGWVFIQVGHRQGDVIITDVLMRELGRTTQHLLLEQHRQALADDALSQARAAAGPPLPCHLVQLGSDGGAHVIDREAIVLGIEGEQDAV